MVTPGYLYNDAANTEAFVGDGWFNSGDLGFISQGRLTLTGREKEIIIINGANFYCYEIEDVVNNIAGVAPTHVAACGVDDPQTGTEGLVIFFTPQQQADLIGDGALLRTIRVKVASTLGVAPTYVIPVSHAAFPKTTSGKIQRTALKEAFLAGDFEGTLKQIDLALANANTLPAWFHRKVWCAAPSAALPLAHQRPLNYLILADGLGLGQALSANLIEQGHRVVLVETALVYDQITPHAYHLNPTDPTHYRHLLASDGALTADRILHLWSYDGTGAAIADSAQLEAAQTRGVYSLLYLVQALAEQNTAERSMELLVVSDGLQAIGAQSDVAYAKAPLLGLLRTIPHELPWLTTRQIDLEQALPQDAVGALAQRARHLASLQNELTFINKEAEVAYRGTARLTPRLTPIDFSTTTPQPLPFTTGGFYLISGGLGGIGVEIARYLLIHYQAKLLLVGRTPLQGEKQQAYEQLAHLAGQVHYAVTDIGDADQLSQAVEVATNDWGQPLTGVIHLAGLYHEELLTAETAATFAAVLRPKVLGTWHLYQLLKNKPDALFITFSSINGFLGGMSVSAYAAANSFLDLFAQQQQQYHRNTYTLAWSMWDDIGMSRGYAMQALTRAHGYQIVTPQQGIYSLLAVLAHRQPQLWVGLDGGHSQIQRHLATAPTALQKLTAYYTTQPTDTAGAVDYASHTLCDLFGTPSQCDTVHLAALPLTRNGLIDRVQLRLGAAVDMKTAIHAVPRTATEKTMTIIWQELLQLTQVGIEDNFFALGGHSLLATQVVSRVRQVFAVELPLRTLFATPTVAGLAHAVTSLQQARQQALRPPLLPAVRSAAMPVSYAQQRLWFLAQMEGSGRAYHIPLVLEVSGSLDISFLQRSWQAIVQRHEVLRTCYVLVEGEVVQQIREEVDVSLRVDTESTASATAIEQWLRRESEPGFDLAVDLPWRMALLRVENNRHILLITLHHIAADGWSLGVLAEELCQHYTALITTTGESLAALPPLAVQYADYASWQREWLQGEVLDQQLAYWRQHLADAPALLELPTDHPRPAVQRYRGASLEFTLERSLVQDLRSLSAKEGVTLFMSLLAAFKALLYRYSGQRDLVVGTPIANRTMLESEPLIGMFVNTLALRSTLENEMRFADLLTQVRHLTQAAYEHQDIPFEQVVEALQPERSLSHAPLFQVMFVLQNNPQPDLSLPGLHLHWLTPPQESTRLDLTLSLMEHEGELLGWWEYNTDLFDKTTIERMVGHFQTLLAGIVANPQQCIGDLSLLTAAERHQLLVEWNDTQVDYPKDKCIHQLFEEQVARTPDAVAVVMAREQRLETRDQRLADDESPVSSLQSLTYRELNARANQLAHNLRSIGVGPDVLVGICVERSIEMVVGLLGILKAGGAYVPLDPNYPQERLAFMLQDSDVPVMLTQAHLTESLPPIKVQVVCLDSDWVQIARNESNTPASDVQAENLAYVIYTSGSTGQPKGVQIRHRALTNFLWTMKEKPGITPNDSLLSVTTLSFDIAGLELYLPLITGGKVIVLDQATTRDGLSLAQIITRSDATVMQATPVTWRLLLTSGWQGTSKLTLLCGGEALPLDLARHLHPCGSELWNMYGPTETTIWSLLYPIQMDDERIAIGRPIANTTVYVLDTTLQPVPVGVSGELYIGGDGLARGYLNCPELTTEKFISNPFGTGRLYKTGDLARWLLDGNIEYLGRVDQQVKIRGFRIELGEIEAVLSQHPDVHEAVVLAHEDTPGEKRLVAYLVRSPESEFTSQESSVHGALESESRRLTPHSGLLTSTLRGYLQSKLPDYMIPSAFVLLEALPLTPNGKVDRKALPVPMLRESAGHATRPRTLVEQQLVQIWEETLDKHPVGIEDNFFELGGHSLLAVRLLATIQQKFGQPLPLRTLFEHPTIMALAQAMPQTNAPTAWSSVVALQPRGAQPPFFCVPGAGGGVLYFHALARALGDQQPFYALESVGLDGKTPPHTTVEAAAAYQVMELQRQQPNGPYLLGGHSFGGFVAFEMAQQLYKAGADIGIVVILDTGAPAVTRPVPDEVDLILLYERLFTEEYGIIPTLTQVQLQSLTSEERLLCFKTALEAANVLPPNSSIDQIRSIFNVALADNQTNYMPVAFVRLPLHLFIAAEEPEVTSQAKIDGWSEYGDVTVHIVPGTHTTMMYESHVQTLARELAACLQAVSQ